MMLSDSINMSLDEYILKNNIQAFSGSQYDRKNSTKVKGDDYIYIIESDDEMDEDNEERFNRINIQESSNNKSDTQLPEHIDMTVQIKNSSNFAKTSSLNWRLMQAGSNDNAVTNALQFPTNTVKNGKGKKRKNKVQQNGIKKKNFRSRGIKQRLGYNMNQNEFQNFQNEGNFNNYNLQLNRQINQQGYPWNQNHICQHNNCCGTNQHINMNQFVDWFGSNNYTRNNNDLTICLNKNMNEYLTNGMVNGFTRHVNMTNQCFPFENRPMYNNNFMQDRNSDMNNLFPTIAALSEIVLNKSMQTQHKHKVVYDMDIQRKLHLLQEKPISNLNFERNTVYTVNGNGVDCVILPDSTKKSLNIRFRGLNE
ncbi:putative mediator of RNA polymerase II transcription subunit 26 [Teleopsis dalmanni]|uniref:putative mediator of RNA polymerase II transcription subunit 26 n=1 Tax=Teleopsis dalmanni TaxID=139649 RepID=UPI0018CD7B45|nr:putative mediator of RNA polymerase II transcription subunit 26 [Teleopsis dalmanni]XP_037950153.1 putative mediator of RNA polymerase II transcription subunit 26 [Teleopsis dalmanni]